MKKPLLILTIIFASMNLFSQILTEEYGTCTSGPLRIRDNPTLTGKILGKLQEGDEILINSRTSYKEDINEDSDFWYLIDNQNGIQGYVFGAFIEIEDNNYNKILYHPEEQFINYDSLVYSTNYELQNTEIQFHNSNVNKVYSGFCHFISFDEELRKILIVTPEFEYGWIDIQNSNFINYYKEVASDYEYEKYGNLFYHSKYLEMNLVNMDENISRNGPLITYSNGRDQVEFIDNIGKRGPYYNIIDKLNKNYILTSLAYYEGLYYGIYNTYFNEIEHGVYSIPLYSQNKQLFACYGTFYDGWEELKIFTITDADIVLVFEHTFEEQLEDFEYIDKIIWENNNSLKIYFEEYSMNAKENNDTWSISKN